MSSPERVGKTTPIFFQCQAKARVLTLAVTRGLTEWGLWCARRRWRVPAGESPARVRDAVAALPMHAPITRWWGVTR